jgi:hypothetical protein
MSRLLIVCLLCVTSTASALVAAPLQSKGANFAGVWALDKSKSEMPPAMGDAIQGGSITITQDDKQITRDLKFDLVEGAQGGGMTGGGGGKITVKLDGSELITESPQGKSVSTAKWMDGGKILEVNVARSFNSPNGELKTTVLEHWELADDGKTLKIHRKQETPRGPFELTWVLTKK